MKPSERVELADAIGRELQNRYTLKDINIYLQHYGIGAIELIENSKRLSVKNALRGVSTRTLLDIATELGCSPNASYLDIRDYLGKDGLKHCNDDFERARTNIEKDPDIAIASACSTLESICKAIIDAFSAKYPSDQSVSGLYKNVAELMDLSPGAHADPEIKRILGGLANAGTGLGALRTKFSSAHGKGAARPRLETRHARLAVNTCSTVGLFLIETYKARFYNLEESENV